MRHNDWGHMGGGTGWSWVFMVLILILIAMLAVVLFRVLGDRGQGPQAGGKRSSARHILDERYARGEIDDAEYDERRRRLDADDGH